MKHSLIEMFYENNKIIVKIVQNHILKSSSIDPFLLQNHTCYKKCHRNLLKTNFIKNKFHTILFHSLKKT